MFNIQKAQYIFLLFIFTEVGSLLGRDQCIDVGN